MAISIETVISQGSWRDSVRFVAVVVVIGAGGFVGSAIVNTLRQVPGTSIRAAMLHPRDIGIPTVQLDLLDPDSLRRALTGADAVVNCARGDRATTVEGTRRLIEVSAASGVRRIVHLSSIAVYGGATGRVDEAVPILPQRSGDGSYAHWKADAERVAISSSTEVVRLRPGIIYGAGSTLWVHDLALRIRSGRWATFGSAGEGICNLVHVTDVAAAVASALTAPLAAGEAFNIDGDTAITWNAWFSRLAEAIGVPPLPNLPPATLRRRSKIALPAKALVRLLPPSQRLFGDWLRAAPAASEVALFGLAATYPADKARRLLDWSPGVSLEDGLVDCARWLRDQRQVA